AAECGAVHAADLRARAWAELGNAHRLGDDFIHAERDFACAMGHAEKGTGNPLLLARIMDLTASLYTDQRRFREAFHLLDWVHAIYRANGELHLAGRALLSKGLSMGYGNDYEEGIRLLAAGLELVDRRGEPELVLGAVHNLVWFLVESGHLKEGRRLLWWSRQLYARHGDLLLSIKVRWIEGKIAAGLGDFDDAEIAFWEARDGFEDLHRPYDVAVISLNLAAVWLAQGRNQEVREMVGELLATFRNLGIRREAIASLLVLQRAVDRERVTQHLVRSVAARLQRLEPGSTRSLATEKS
ncbi:MAG: hypothetical protein M3O15_00005, partial [Acidobacteriota bacterium]|nr:hypothetical protein [Acidobacteriota bacterium]